jgi:hypothetical protein
MRVEHLSLARIAASTTVTKSCLLLLQLVCLWSISDLFYVSISVLLYVSICIRLYVCTPCAHATMPEQRCVSARARGSAAPCMCARAHTHARMDVQRCVRV